MKLTKESTQEEKAKYLADLKLPISRKNLEELEKYMFFEILKRKDLSEELYEAYGRYISEIANARLQELMDKGYAPSDG